MFTTKDTSITFQLLDEISQVIDDFENDVFQYVHKFKPKDTDSYLTVILKTCSKVLVTIREIIILCRFGYSDGALALSRNIYEQMIILALFESKKTLPDFNKLIKNYFLDYEVKRLKTLKLYHDLRNESSKKEHYSKELQDIAKETGLKLNGDYWWVSISSFQDIVRFIIDNQDENYLKSFIIKLNHFYKRACISLHACCMGNSIRISKEVCSHTIDTTPDFRNQGVPLYLTLASLVYIVGVSCDILGIEFQQYKTHLNDLCKIAESVIID